MPVQNVDLTSLVNFTEKQKIAYDKTKDHRFVLFGGAAGGGKSRWLRWSLLLILLRFWTKYNARVHVGLFCEDYPTLKDRQISKIAIEMPSWLGKIKDDRDIGLSFMLKPQFGGGAILLRNLDDPAKYDSAEFAAVGIDELTKNKVEIFDEIRKRIRWPNLPPGTILPFLGGTNPGGIGHAFVKDYWVDVPARLPPWLERYRDQFAFVQSFASDNPYNPATYYEELRSLPPDLARAYADGDWNIFKGQFYKEWRSDVHVCDPFPISSYWKRFKASDWGYSAPWCILWFAVSPDGEVFIYRELYKTTMTAPAMTALSIEMNGGEEYKYKLLDPACWDSSRGVSIADQCAAAGETWQKADNDRISGYTRVREYLAWRKDEHERLVQPPKLRVFSTCIETIRTMPAMVYDKLKVEMMDEKGEDHAPDTVRYGLMSLPGVTIIPLEAMEDEYAEAALRAAHEEKPKPQQQYDLS